MADWGQLYAQNPPTERLVFPTLLPFERGTASVTKGSELPFAALWSKVGCGPVPTPMEIFGTFFRGGYNRCILR